MIKPNYWMNETSGVLRPAILAYLNDEEMTGEQIAAMRAYLRQWINADGWAHTKELERLRSDVHQLGSRLSISSWISAADRIGIDPL